MSTQSAQTAPTDDDALKLEVLAEIVAVTGDPGATAQSAYDQVMGLWEVAQRDGDTARASAITATWGAVNGQIARLQAQGQTAIDLAAAAKVIAAELTGQRDAALEQHKALRTAVLMGDEDHPIVATLAASMYEEALEVVESDYHVATQCMACDMQVIFPDSDHDDLMTFFELISTSMLTTFDQAEEAALHAEIAAFMTATAKKHRAIQAAMIRRANGEE